MTIGINPETGEVGGWYPLKEGVQVTTAKQREAAKRYFQRQEANELRKGMRWVACYHDAIREITKELSLTEAGVVIRLLPYLRFKTNNQLIENGKPLKQADIQRIIGRSRMTTIGILNRLEELGVVTKEIEGRCRVYSISMNFHTYGDVHEGAKFTKLYQHQANERTKELTLNEIGLLYKVLPYFHYKTFYLCMNPDESEESLLEHITREELAELVGYDPDTISKLVSRLRSKGVILSTHSCNSIRYIAHPDVVYRQEGEDVRYADGIRKLFKQHMLRRTKKRTKNN